MQDDDLTRIDNFFNQGLHWDYLTWRAANELGGLPMEVAQAVGLALGYMLRSESTTGRHASYGPFPPIWEMDGKVSAPPPKDVPASLRKIWAELASQCKSASARARFNDLLWVAREKPNAGAYARSAVEAYLELASMEWPSAGLEVPEDGSGRDSWNAFRRAACLRRALEISSELKDRKLQMLVGQRLADRARGAIDADASIGAVFMLLRSLLQLPPDQRPAGLSELVDLASTKYATSAGNFDQIAEMRIALAKSDEERRSIRAEQLARWTAQAKQSEGISRLFELQKALEFARVHGFPDRLEELRREIDRLDPASLGLGQISVPIEMSGPDIEAYVAEFIRPEGWRESLRAFGSAGGSPPSGDHDENLAFVEELRSTAPLQFIVPTIEIDEGGRPLTRTANDDDHEKLALHRQERLGIVLWGTIGVRILDGIFAKFGIPTEAELEDYLTTDLIPRQIAAKLAHAHRLYLDGRYDDCAHVLVPRIEAIVRELCLRVGVSVAREPFGSDSGGVAPLGNLLRALKSRGLDLSWIRYLLNALVEPTGLNLRNRISHGLLDEAGQTEAVILLHIANFLRGVTLSAQPDGPGDQQTSS